MLVNREQIYCNCNNNNSASTHTVLPGGGAGGGEGWAGGEIAGGGDGNGEGGSGGNGAVLGSTLPQDCLIGRICRISFISHTHTRYGCSYRISLASNERVSFFSKSYLIPWSAYDNGVALLSQ